MRVGRVTAVDDFPEARRPAWKLTIDFGPEIGTKRSFVADHQLQRGELEDSLVVAVVNFPPKQIGLFVSECLVLGALDPERGVILLGGPTGRSSPATGSPSRHPAAVGGRVGELDVLAGDGDELAPLRIAVAATLGVISASVSGMNAISPWFR